MPVIDTLPNLFRAVAAHFLTAADSDYTKHVDRAIDLLQRALSQGHKLLVFGNGGSAADAQHLAAELVGRFARDRPGLPAIALTTNQSLLTAWSNDREFETVFVRQIEALGRRGDVALGISTSGASTNVVSGLRRARELGLTTLALTGAGGDHLSGLCDVLMAVPLTDTPRVQEVHLVTYHAICAVLEERLFGPQT